ncbi:MAG: DNA polymerase I [Bacteroidaceae bacterium]|nr:DNA polymerase I [Bacteroidaceae bacterium]
MQKLYLLDAYALIYRAYYAFIKNPRINSKGENTSAILGFVNTLDDVMSKGQPTHLGVAFDPHGPTFRHEAFPEYKAQREETPEAIRFAVPIIKEILAAYRIPVLEVQGYEADDIIGTLAQQADERGIETYMMTPDKDYGQLVTERVRMYRPPMGRNSEAEILGPEEVKKKWGLQSPRQVIDMLGLMGDAVDNIPGCPGVGEKTAQKLIEEFGSIENLLASTSKLKGALREKVENNVEQIKQSKWLATICKDVPIALDMDALQVKEPDSEKLQELFRRLEFRQLLNKAAKESPLPPAKKEEEKKNTDGSQQLDLFATNAEPASAKGEEQAVQLDLFSQGFTQHAVQPDTARSVSLHSTEHEPTQHGAFSAPPFVVISSPSEKDGREVVGHNLKAQWKALKQQQLTDLPMFDTEIAHYILHPEMRHYLDYLLSIYGCSDVVGLKKCLEEELHKEGLWDLFAEIEMPLMPVLAEMEEAGVMIDTEGLKETSRLFTEQMLALEKEIHAEAGIDFNISSPKQVGEVLFDRLKLDSKAKKTKTGQYVTNEEVLEALRRKHPIVGKILDYRGLKKLLSTYIDALPQLINKETGHIHTSFNQTVTATGRLSSSNPNLQNIPVRDAQGKEVRKAFIPYPGQLFFSADYSQIELRIMAHLSQDPNLIEAFLEGNDIHAATAAKIFKKPIGEVTSDERRKAKTANFGIIYGISAFGLAERLGVGRSEAKQLIDEYFQTYPGVKAYMEKSIEMARERGFTETIFHRRCQLPDINSHNAVVRGYAERNAINAPIQGSAADIIKIAMVRVHRRMKQEGLKSKMILQVHDELNFSVLPEEKEKLQSLVIEEMQGAASLSVPLIADCGWGTNWLEAH